MKKYEAIFAVKEDSPSHLHGNEVVSCPVYRISRRQFEAQNEEDAREKCREERHSIEDCFATVKTLSLSTTSGLEVPRYSAW